LPDAPTVTCPRLLYLRISSPRCFDNATGTIDSRAKCPFRPPRAGPRSASTPSGSPPPRDRPSPVGATPAGSAWPAGDPALWAPGPHCDEICAHSLGQALWSQSRARTFWETWAKLFPRIYPAAPRHRGALTCEDITTTAVAGCARSGVARSGIAEAGGDPELAAGADDHQQPAADDGALVLGQRKQGRACRGVDDSSRAAPSGLLPRASAAAYVLAPARPGRSQWRPRASSPPGGVGRGPARPPSGPQAKKQRWTDRPGR
jgi:hypothetical protein